MKNTNYKLLLVTIVLILLCFIDLAMAFMYRTADARVGIENVLPAFGNYELIDIDSDKNGKVSVQNTHKISLQEAYDPSKNLEKYGRQLADSTENNAIALSNVVKTTEQPIEGL